MRFFRKQYLWLLLLLLPLAAVAAGIILDDIPENDTAHRYAPMAEAFAAGDWGFAFHPRIQPLQIICGGIVAFLTGANGFLSLKIASALWHFAGGAMLFFMFRELYRSRKYIAVTALALYFLFPYSFHSAVSGLRESAKSTILILAAWGLIRIFRSRTGKSGYCMLSISCALGILNRVDMIPVSLLLFTIGTVMEWQQRKFPVNSLIFSAGTALPLLANSLLNDLVFPGTALPDCRMVELFTACFHRQPGIGDAVLLSLLAAAGIFVAAFLGKYAAKSIRFRYAMAAIILLTAGLSGYTAYTLREYDPDVHEFIMQTIKGFYHFAGLFEILCILTMWQLKKLVPEEKILIAVVLINAATAIIFIQLAHHTLYITSRYLAPALPLWMGFFVMGVKAIYDFVLRYLPKWFSVTLLILSCTAIAGGLIYHMFQPYLRMRYHHRHKAIRNCTLATAAEIRKHCTPGIIEIKEKKLYTYLSRKSPKIYFFGEANISAAAFLAGGSVADSPYHADLIVGNKPPAGSDIQPFTTLGQTPLYLWRLQ